MIPFHTVTGPEDAPTLLLSNSLGTTLEMWDPQAAQLAERFRLVRYDTRGHGSSPIPPSPYSIDDLGSDLIELLDHLDVERAHIAGLSLGGMTAMWLAAHVPDRVRSLVAVSTGLKIGARSMWEERIRQVRAGGTESIADASMGRWFTEGFRGAHPGVVSWCRAMLTGCQTDGYISCCRALMDADLHTAAQRIVAPTMVVVGREDPVTPPANAQGIVEHIAGARLLMLDASHICAVEQPRAFNDAVLTFLGARS